MKEKNNSKKLLIGIVIAGILLSSIFFAKIYGGKNNITGNAIINTNNLTELKIKVSIPCPGHASIIKGEVLKLAGISSVDFNFPNVFTIKYNSKQTSEQDILNLSIFKEYPAKKI